MKGLTLHFRFGSAVNEVDEAAIRRAVVEVAHEDGLAGVSRLDLEEHPSCWLEYGRENGDKWEVNTLSYYRTGQATLTVYADQDDDEPEFSASRELPEEQVIQLMRCLADGELAAVRSEFV